MKYKFVLFTIFFIHSLSLLWAQEEIKWNNDIDIVKENQKEIAIGYGSQPEYKVTSSINTISGVELEKSFNTNLINSLAGRIPGFTVSQGSDEAGIVDNTMRIRGVGTFMGSQDPLIVIDGFVTQYKDDDGLYRTLLSQLVPEEIESITLLKDASATAIYGLRGANGVLLITTKRGTVSPLKVSFSGKIGFQQASRLPKYLNSHDYATLYNEAYRNTNNTQNNFHSDEALAYYKNAAGTNRYLYPDVDWYEETLRSAGVIYDANLNFRGGNEIVKYFVLLNYMGNDGLIKRTESLSDDAANQSYSRYNIRTNADINVTKEFSAHITLGIAIEDKTNPGGRDAGKNTNSLFQLIDLVSPNSFPVRNPNGSWGGNGMFSNPLGNITERGFWTYNARNINATLKLTEKLDMLTPGLSISGAVSFNSFYLGYSNKYRDYEYYAVSKDPDTGEITYSNPPFGINESISIDDGISDQWRNTTIQGFLNYDRKFNAHDINAMVMYKYENEEYGAQQAYKHEGMASRVTYTLMDKYMAEFSFGLEATETFRKGKRTGFFPAGSIGWILTNENFLKNNDYVKYLKVRTSYGLTGNDKIGGSERFMYTQDYGYREGYNFGARNDEIGGLAELRMANPDITWEKEKKFNVGIEVDISGRLGFSFDYFNNRRNDILCLPNSTIPSHIGAELPYMNIGKTKNHGFEASIKYNGSINDEFRYFTQLNAWMAKNKIVYQSEELKTEANNHLYSTGLSIYQPFYLEAIGFYTQEEIDDPDIAKPTWKDVLPGDLKYKDHNKDGIIDSNDKYPIGYTDIPEITLGLNIGFAYKGFDFTAFFHAALNRSVYLGNTPYYRAFQDNGKISEFALNRWTSEETAGSATYPRLSLTNEQNNFRESSFWQCNGNFLKLRSIELGYSFNNVLSASDLRVFINGTNVFSIDKVKGYDPERIGNYPAVRTFSAGARIQF